MAPAAGGTLLANHQVRLRATTWREQLALVVALPFVFVFWAVMPLSVLGVWPGMLFGGLVGLLPTAIVYRGQRVLRRVRRQLDDVTALPRLEALARGTVVGTAVRCDALAHAALIRLEMGELEAALNLLATPMRDSGSSVRARTPMVGHYGEAVRSVMAWLFPESHLEALDSLVLRPTQESPLRLGYEGVPDMLAILRLLEASHRNSAAAVRRAWTELDSERLSRRHPLLIALILGVVRRVEPSVQADLDARVAGLSEAARQVVMRRFPELDLAAGATYRLPATSTSTAVARVAPTALQALHAERGVSRWLPVSNARGPWAVFFSLWVVLAGVGSADGTLILVGMVFAALGVGSIVHRRRRVRPLVAAGIRAPGRVRELSMMGSRTGPRIWGTSPPHPFDRGELMLVVGLARAEDKLLEGDPAGAREQIGWWLEGLDRNVLANLDLHAIASTVLRVAALLRYDNQAKYLNARIRVGHSPRIHKRTGHGDAPRALWLARALHFSVAGDDAAAVRALDVAAKNRRVTLDRFETELYGAVVRRLADRGHVIPADLSQLLALDSSPAWLEAVWPEPTTKKALTASKESRTDPDPTA